MFIDVKSLVVNSVKKPTIAKFLHCKIVHTSNGCLSRISDVHLCGELSVELC
jgi:hypothetical protein